MKNKILKKSVIPILVAGMFISTEAFTQNNTQKKDTIIFNYKISENYVKNEYGVDTSNYKLNVVEYGKSLIEKLTNKSFPKDVLIKTDSLWNGSYYNSRTKTLEVGTSGSYSYSLLNFMHEIGHVFDPKDQSKRDINGVIRNEAMAFMLEFISPYLINDKKLKEELLVTLKWEKKAFEENSKIDERYELHQKAIQLADAIITYFNDPIKGYNYLANRNYEEIDPKIFEMFEKNLEKVILEEKK